MGKCLKIRFVYFSVINNSFFTSGLSRCSIPHSKKVQTSATNTLLIQFYLSLTGGKLGLILCHTGSDKENIVIVFVISHSHDPEVCRTRERKEQKVMQQAVFPNDFLFFQRLCIQTCGSLTLEIPPHPRGSKQSKYQKPTQFSGDCHKISL